MISFGKRVELLTDGYLIDSMDGLSFRYERPEKLGMVLPFDRPWEKEGSLGLSAIDDGDRVMLYYRGFPGDDRNDYDEKQTSCLAVSEDGVHFERAQVNRIDYDGIRENNIVRMDINCHNFAPFLDTNPACRPGERFKAIGGLLSTGGLRAWSSPDGIDWTLMAEEPVITDGVFDSMNMAFKTRRRAYTVPISAPGRTRDIRAGGASPRRNRRTSSTGVRRSPTSTPASASASTSTPTRPDRSRARSIC